MSCFTLFKVTFYLCDIIKIVLKSLESRNVSLTVGRKLYFGDQNLSVVKKNANTASRPVLRICLIVSVGDLIRFNQHDFVNFQQDKHCLSCWRT